MHSRVQGGRAGGFCMIGGDGVEGRREGGNVGGVMGVFGAHFMTSGGLW